MANPTRRTLLVSSAVLVPKFMTAAPVVDSPLLRKVRIGAEFFLNRSETAATIESHFRRMAETGLTIARIFTIWDDVERQQGLWDFSRYDMIYDAAAKNGILIANTLCSEDPPGWMGTAPFYHQWQDLADPKLRPYSEIYIERVVSRYRGHKAHGVWLLQNEPGIRGPQRDFLLPLFAEWLRRKYGSVEALNKRWYRPLKRFEDVPFPVQPNVAGWADYPSLLDWRTFLCDHLARQQMWLRGQVERHHAGSLTHSNPPGLTTNMISAGRDLWRIKPSVDFLGASMHAAWQFGAFKREDFGVAYGYCCDLVRSASSPAPYWVTELQAGPTILTGSRPLNPTGEEITHWLWDGIGNGARGIVFWLWHPRTEGNEAGEWGLAGASGEETARTRATKAVAKVLAANEAFFSAAKPLPARAAILFSPETLNLHGLETWRKPNEDAMHSLMGCYKALHRAQVPVDFIYSGELEQGAASRYRVLYLPYCYALTARAVAAIRRFVEQGGTLWADGMVAWKNENGETSMLPPGDLSSVFGFKLEDVDALWEPFPLSAEGEQAGESWRCVVQPTTAKVLLRDSQGRVTATENSYGKGRAIYYTTALSLAVLRRELPLAERWIAAPAVEASAGLPIRARRAPERVSFRALTTPDEAAVLLNNWGPEGTATIAFPAAVRSVTDLLSGTSAACTLEAGVSKVEWRIERGGAAVLHARLR